MNINKNKIIICTILILVIITSAIVGIVFAVNETSSSSNNDTKVIIEQSKEDEKQINVGLKMANETEEQNSASVTSFQIGLNIDAIENVGIVFTFDNNLDSKDNKTKKLATYNYDEQNKKLYIYYSGIEELNDLQSSDILKVGTITIDTKKETTVNITPIDGFSTASSIDFSETIINSVGSGSYKISATNINNSSGKDPSKNPGGNVNDDKEDNNQGGNVNENTDQSTGDNTNSNQSSNENGTIIDKVISATKTGANHSVMRILIPLVILIIVAFALIYLKSKLKSKNSKH